MDNSREDVLEVTTSRLLGLELHSSTCKLVRAPPSHVSHVELDFCVRAGEVILRTPCCRRNCLREVAYEPNSDKTYGDARDGD